MVLSAVAQTEADVRIDTRHLGAEISPTLHGVFFEEISHAGEGGLYAELIRNRGFEDFRLPPGTTLENGFIVPPRTPHFMLYPRATDWKMEWNETSQWPAWSMAGAGMLSLSDAHPLNSATPHSLQVDIQSGTVDVINEGFWGIPVVQGDKYDLKFYMRGKYAGVVRASLRGADGKVLAEYVFRDRDAEDAIGRAGSPSGPDGWHKYTCILTANATDPRARFFLSFDRPGRVWLDFVSLFPEKTFRNRPNGLRQDLARYIADLKPAFIRWPGGCYVEGLDIQSAPDWKRTIGPVEQRAGTYSPWGYWSSDGFGYQEYLQYCEDIGAAALYVFNVGVSCEFRSGTFIPDDSLEPYIQNALDAIEYAVGPVTSKWGKVRAANGHPSPFPLKYVEVGNEQHGPRYALRYNRFFDAIREKYPSIRIIASMGIGDVNRNTLDSMRHTDLVDEHSYKGVSWAMNHYYHFDQYHRGNWQMYVGEYATNSGVGRGNMAAALSDAVYIMGMERNSDLVKMSSYAPLLVNVNDESWPVNLINFDDSRSFARISYYAIKMFSENRPDVNFSTAVNIHPPPEKPADFAGGIGLATWDTQSEYRDITVTKDGKVVYQSDFVNRPGEWKKIKGNWTVSDSALAQTEAGAQRLALLEGKTFDTYTLTVKARKKSGYNAFIIPFAVKNEQSFLRAHIGSWVDSHSVFEKVTDGFDVSDISDQKPLKHPLDTGRWYTIRLEVGADKVEAYLDDSLLLTYREPDKLYAISGKDRQTGDVVVKMVNAGSTVCKTTVVLDGTPLATGTLLLTTLTAGSENAENSFDHPTEYIPHTSVVPAGEVELPPYSVNVLRVKR